jgi:hypothetical protein
MAASLWVNTSGETAQRVEAMSAKRDASTSSMAFIYPVSSALGDVRT